MDEHAQDRERDEQEGAAGEPGEPGARGGASADRLPAAPAGDDDTPLGDTDQHSSVPSDRAG